MNHQIKYLRHTELHPTLAPKLQPFISAYRDHDQPPTKKDLDQDDRKDNESPLSQDNILDTYKAIKHNQDVAWLGYKRKYLAQYSGYRSHYALGYND